MTAKGEYLPRYVKAGVKAKDARERVEGRLVNGGKPNFAVMVTTYNHSYDTKKNETAHFLCSLISYHPKTFPVRFLDIVDSGSYRRIVGFSGENEAAIFALESLGYVLDKTNVVTKDKRKLAIYPLIDF